MNIIYTSTRCFQDLKLKPKGNIHKKKVLLSEKQDLFIDNNKKKVSLSKKQDLILKKRPHSEEKVLLNRKTGIANAIKI